ncbi:MAG: transglycosylase SLT domain-containing protein, partial [Acidimicrobiales bacterium]
MFRLAALTLGAPFLAALPVALMVTLLAPGGPDQPAGAGTGAGPVAGLPPAMLGLYRRASATCPGLSWTVLAAVGTIESANGTSAAPGVHSGANSAGAEGPMQFEPATFASYALPVPPGGAVPPTPYDPTDAVYAAARDLCTNGAGTATGLPAAVFAYNHDHAYVHQVLTLAAGYAATPA